MTRSNQPTFLSACALTTMLLLSACGGGSDPAPVAQTITFASPGSQTFGVAPAALVATASSGLAVSLTSTTAGVCTVSGTTLTLVGGGTCTVVASQPGNASFLAATPVSNSFSVVTAQQTITFASPGNQTFGVAPAALVATASSGLAVPLASTTASVCTVSGTTLTLVDVGTCTVVASQPGNASFVAATPVSNSFNVVPTPQTITFISPGNQTLGTAPPALSATASSALSVTLTSTTTGICTTSGTTLTLLAVGNCTISASQAGTTTIAAAPAVVNTFAIAAAPLAAQTITFASPGTQTFGTAPPALVASSSSALPVTLTSMTTSVCTVSGTALTLAAAGNCTIVASQAGNGSFTAAANVSQTFTVAQTPQAITFVSPGNQTLGTAPAALVAAASSGLPVSLASTTTGICTASGTVLTLVAAGSCTINASQAGDANVAAAAPVSRTFTVNAAPLTAQTITFASPGNQTLGTAPPALVATASSTLPVTLTSTTTGICTVSGTALTLVAAGPCTIVASQSGNSSFAAAANVSQTFTVVAPLGVELMANGGFETAATLPGQFAFGWRGVNGSPATLTSADARSGSFSASLAIADPGFNGSGLVQNAVDDGLMSSILGLHTGRTTVLTFWAKGNASVTGNVNFSLRYLNSVGGILNPVVNTRFDALINPNTWTLITLNGPAIPALTSAIFLEMTLAVGPTGVQPPGNCGVDPITGLPLPCDNGQARILIDDVSVRVGP